MPHNTPLNFRDRTEEGDHWGSLQDRFEVQWMVDVAGEGA